MTSIIWVNVTTLMSWARPAVGVVRVEQEYVRWILSQPSLIPAVRFVIFDAKKLAFFEVTAQTVRAKLAHRYAVSGAAATSVEDRLKLLAKRLTRFVPPALLPKARSAALAAIQAIRYFQTHIRKSRLGLDLRPDVYTPSSGRPSSGRVLAQFSQSDVFVSMGLDWDQLDLPMLYRSKAKYGFRVVLMCYDAIPVLFPHLVVAESGRFGAYLVELGWCADHVLCISQSTRNDFLSFTEHMGGPSPATSVIRLGDALPADSAGQQAAESAAVLQFDDRPFVLYVSTIERRKNHELLYRAWIRLKAQAIEVPRLIFVGMPGWGVSDFLADLRLDYRVAGDILVLNHVTDGELRWLYQHSLFTLYPSLYEGWGLPVTESLAHGKFCLCARSASIPEAGGDLCEYLDPWDLPAWTDRIGYLIQHPEEIAQRNLRVRQEFVPQKWADTARQIHQAATSLCAGPPVLHHGPQHSPYPGIHCRKTSLPRT